MIWRFPVLCAPCIIDEVTFMNANIFGYDFDFYAWTRQQTGLLKTNDFSKLDIEHLIEEITSLGERDRREACSRLILVLMHLLKWQYQPARRGASWRRTINEQRTELELLFDDSRSLRNIVAEGYDRCYELSRKRVSDETGIPLDKFPENCLWTCEEVLRSGFWPH